MKIAILSKLGESDTKKFQNFKIFRLKLFETFIADVLYLFSILMCKSLTCQIVRTTFGEVIAKN